MLRKQVELVLLCWGITEKASLDSHDGRNAPGSDKKLGITFLSFLDSEAAKLPVFTVRGLHRTACLRFLNQESSQAKNTYPRKLLECFLTYFEALQYPKSAKTCKVQAGLECCTPNNAQQCSFRRDILHSITLCHSFCY